MNSDTETVQKSLEALAETETDIAAAVYAHFTANTPQAQQHISFMDERMRGRMLDQIYKLLLGDVDNQYLEFETRTHRGYGADLAQYRGIFAAVKAAVKAALADNWDSATDTAWERSIARIIDTIEQLSQTAAQQGAG